MVRAAKSAGVDLRELGLASARVNGRVGDDS